MGVCPFCVYSAQFNLCKYCRLKVYFIDQHVAHPHMVVDAAMSRRIMGIETSVSSKTWRFCKVGNARATFRFRASWTAQLRNTKNNVARRREKPARVHYRLQYSTLRCKEVHFRPFCSRLVLFSVPELCGLTATSTAKHSNRFRKFNLSSNSHATAPPAPRGKTLS